MAETFFNLSENKFIGALALEKIFSKSRRKTVSGITVGLAFLVFLPIAYLAAARYISLPFKETRLAPFVGVFFILLASRLFLLSLDAFYNSKTYDKKGEKGELNLAKRLNLYAAGLFYESISVKGDAGIKGLTEALTETLPGRILLLRLGIYPEEFTNLKKMSADKPDTDFKKLLEILDKKSGGGQSITFTDIIQGLIELDENLRNFLTRKNITPATAANASRWIERELEKEDLSERWWRKERLGRVSGLAKDWAFGHTYLLERFSRDLRFEARNKSALLIGRERETELLESALLKQTSANVLIIGDAGGGRENILLGLVRMITLGKIFPELEHKRVLELSGSAVIAEGKTKGEVEELLIKIMNEAVQAGNVIFAINDFPEFVESLSEVGVNASEVLGKYLESPDIHIIASGNTLSYRRNLEGNPGLLKYFEKIEVEEPDTPKLMEILENLVPRIEKIAGRRTFLTYPALEKINESATRYLVQGALPKRAIDLMEEVIKEAASKKIPAAGPELVMEIVRAKTKMPLGEIKKEEQEKLLNLEKLLHQRVVGQDKAIDAIADAIRRSRSGIQNPKRPIGTFLFLGPTGVGKTESAKALAEVYFGDENAMVRLDMTEYQGEEALGRLLGSFEKNEAGILASKMRSNPYTVLLLDEFEKSHQKVKNLFLQILDEGFFSDYQGVKINMRNAIIIATSNAGATRIQELVKTGKDLSVLREEIISYILKEEIMSPELVNRFDAVVIFHPLPPEMLRQISKIMLEKLRERLKTQNIMLKITEPLIRSVAEGGYDPAMGARPMQRYIQDKVEELIAEKIIKKEIRPGVEFELSPEEIKK